MKGLASAVFAIMLIAPAVGCTAHADKEDTAPPADNTAAPASGATGLAQPAAPVQPTTVAQPTPASGLSPATPAPGAASSELATASPSPEPAASGPQYHEVTVPAGTILHVALDTPVASDTSHVEQPVRGTLRRAIAVEGVQVLPAGTAVMGHVTAARRPGRVKGRGYIAMRFSEVDTPGAGTTRISSATVGHTARATKEKDTLKIVAPAAGAAVLGRVVGGKGAARKGAAIGGAAGTGYVLATRGEEARLGKGASLAVKLTAPLTVRVPVTR